MKLTGAEKDLGGFSVRRLFPSIQCKSIGPFVFFDHMGPADFHPGEGLNVRPHPHIGLATITYLFAGELLHQDSLGSVQAVTPGAINLMIAGRGIVHSERTAEPLRASGQHAEGLQLWIGLPENAEQMEPEFHHYAAKRIPETRSDGAHIRLLIGEGFGLRSPVKQLSPTFYAAIELEAGAQLRLPEHVAEWGIYLLNGSLRVDDHDLGAHEMLVCKDGSTPRTLLAEQPCRFALIGGDALGKRFIDWNFVSSDPARIEQAKRDWQAGRFALVPTDQDEFIPLPE